MSAMSPWKHNEYCPKCFGNFGYHVLKQSFCAYKYCLWEGLRVGVLNDKQLRKLKIQKIDDKI